MAERHHKPSSVAAELGLLAGSLESIKREIERGVAALGDHWDESFARHVGRRIANTEGILQEMRLDIASAPFKEDRA